MRPCPFLSQYLFLLLICLLSSRGGFAKKELDTPSPSTWPTFAPTVAPTATATANTTLSPTQNATEAVTEEPTSTPTATPTVAIVISEIRLPVIGIDIVVDDEAGTLQSSQQLEDDLSAFIDELLETNSGVDTFDYAALEFDFIHSSFNGRRLASGLSIRIKGNVYYGDNPPSSESLAISLWTYFAVWGIEELENYIKLVGIESASVAAVSIDNEVVRPVEDTEAYNPGATVQQPKTQGNQTVSPAAIAGLAASCTALILVVAFLIWNPRNRKSSKARQARSYIGENNSRMTAGVSPELPPRQVVQEIDDLSVGGMSADMSIYTTGNSVFSATIPTTYDTKRLDRIIEMGKNRADSERVAI